ncbi:MAG: hypothetical protein H3C62_12095 [Gemmatimonadaceae bacterium]|nr:hypothetical protein [Gemmatimonadaceae bacterium]
MTAYQGGPFLTARADGGSTRILDPLGMDATGAAMIRQHLFPGMTGGLQHIRYFSLMSWIVGSFHERRANSSWRVYARRVEHALRIGALHAEPALRGIIGRDSTPVLTGLAGGAQVSLDKKVPSAFGAQYYGASFEALGFARRPRDEAPRFSALGTLMWEAAETEVEGQATSVRKALELLRAAPSEMRVSQLIEASAFLQLRQIRPGAPEHQPLTRAFVGRAPIEPRSDGARATRARSLALLLDIINEETVAIESAASMLEVLWNGRVSRASKDEFPAELATWRCFGERQEQRAAIGAIWYIVRAWMSAEAPRGIAPSLLGERAVSLLPLASRRRASADLPCADMTWGQYEDIVAEAAGATVQGRSSYRRGLRARVSVAGSGAPTAEERLRLALQLMAATTSAWRVEERGADMATYALHAHGGAARMTLPWFASMMETKRGESVATVVRWLIERCALDQVQRVGYAKGPGISKVVLVREDDEVRFARETPRDDPFMQDANRLQAALAMLEGIALIKRQQDRFVTTAAGRSVLAALTGPRTPR